MTVKYIYLLSALFGLLLPMAVRAQNVSNTGAYPQYASPYVFHKNTATDIGYAYNSNGSMTRNPDRHIGLIEYDGFNNPRLIQFTDGSATEYVYDASGTKLKTVHRTAVPGIEVPYGTVYEHTASTVLSSDSTLYAGPFVLSGDSLRYKYDGGSVLIPLDGSPVKPCFYALDHLGSVRLVVSADGQVIERNDYYPSGCLITENIDGETVILPYKYNGKELDPMHGLYTYDYGARQYDPATTLWDRMDPLCEKYYNVSPYVYCHNNPVNMTDPDGKDDLFDENGNFLVRTKYGTSVMIKSGEGYTKITNVDFSNNQKVIENIGRHYLAKSDKGNFSLRVSGTDEDVPRGVAFSHTIGTDNYDLYLTDGYVNPSLGDYNDFECITYHESVHRYNPNAGYTPSGEIEAIIQTTKCEAWNNATLNYIESQAAYAKNKLNEMKVETNINNCLQRVQSAFAGYANFEYSKGIVDMSNLMEEVIIWGTKK